MQELNRRTTAMKQPLGVFDYTNEQYHASEGLSRSSLWTFKQLPYKFWYEKLSGQYEPPGDKEAFVLGDVVHAMVLEPSTFNDRYMVMPNIDKRTKSGKELYAEVMIEAAGKTLVKPETMQLAQDMANALMSNNTVCDLLRDAKMEKSIYWKHEPTGLICKARPDIWQGRIVSDLKTTIDAGFRGFQMSAYKYGYFLQCAMIYEALKSIGEPFHNYVNICVEKTKPHALGLYMVDDAALQFGIDQYHYLMESIYKCYETNVWPDYGIQKLTIPTYATMEVQGEQ
jgi:exodeoxyribonuclease VIII